MPLPHPHERVFGVLIPRPPYVSASLSIRPSTRQEQVQLNEGCLFRIHMDADWLETDVIAIEFRLLSRSLPDHEVPTEETGGAKDKPPEPLKEVRILCMRK